VNKTLLALALGFTSSLITLHPQEAAPASPTVPVKATPPSELELRYGIYNKYVAEPGDPQIRLKIGRNGYATVTDTKTGKYKSGRYVLKGTDISFLHGGQSYFGIFGDSFYLAQARGKTSNESITTLYTNFLPPGMRPGAHAVFFFDDSSNPTISRIIADSMAASKVRQQNKAEATPRVWLNKIGEDGLKCEHQMHTLSLATLQHSVDYAERFWITTANFKTALQPYYDSDAADISHCPLDTAQGATYSVNPFIIGWKREDLMQKSKYFVLFYEGKNQKLDFRHNGYACVNLIDGSVINLTKNDHRISWLRWQP
jgi:hypothetical protein